MMETKILKFPKIILYPDYSIWSTLHETAKTVRVDTSKQDIKK